MKVFRTIVSLVAALLAALFLWSALTVPAFAATAPAILGIACAAVAFFAWPRRQKATA